jgi:hypothetical protein
VFLSECSAASIGGLGPSNWVGGVVNGSVWSNDLRAGPMEQTDTYTDFKVG